MFDKIKSRKAPLSLSSVSNAIKSSGNQDLTPPEFQPKQLDSYTSFQLGIPPNSIVAVAHDPVQSLLAIATSNNGKNEIRVYGQNFVEVVFEFKQTSPMTLLMFVKGVYLVAVLPLGGGVTVISLHSKSILGTFLPPGSISAVLLDPALDWLVIGLANGQVVVYDVDRLSLTPFRIDNLQKRVLPKQRLLPVVHLEWHPRDIGTLLVTFSHCTVVFSMTTGEIVSAFVFELQKGFRGYEMAQLVANGGKKRLFGSSLLPVVLEVSEAHFHPNGLHVVTIHRDSSIVFWDAQDGTLLHARTISELGLNHPGPSVLAQPASLFAPDGFDMSAKWVCTSDPENTQLLVAVGDTVHVLDFGTTLKYSLTSHDKQSEFYAKPLNGTRSIPVSLNTLSGHQINPALPKRTEAEEYVNAIVPFASESMPYFAGGFSPSYLALRTNFGGLYIVKYADQMSSVISSNLSTSSSKAPFDPYAKSNSGSLNLSNLYAVDSFPSSDSQSAAVSGSSKKSIASINLPPSIGLVSPPVRFSQVVSVRKVEWFSICPSRSSHTASLDNPSLLQGGAGIGNTKAPKSIGYDETIRIVLLTGHDDGIVRLLDVSRGDHQEIENVIQFEILSYAIRGKINQISCAFESKELIIGLSNGQVVICKYGRAKPNKSISPPKANFEDCPVFHTNEDLSIVGISHRCNSFSNSSNFLPSSLLKPNNPETFEDCISCLKISDVGFAAVAYTSGKLVVCDITRGPAIIFNCPNILQYVPSASGSDQKLYASSVEFSIMEYGQEGYSSIMLLVGTSAGGNFLMFKIIPQSNGAFECVFVDKLIGLNYKNSIIGVNSKSNTSNIELKINQIIPIGVKSGDSAAGQLSMFHRLGLGIVIPAYVITSSPRDIRVLKLPKQKLAHKVVEDICLCSGIIRPRVGKGVVLAVLTKSGFIKFLSIPTLNELADVRLSKETFLQVRDAFESGVSCESDVLPSGEIFIKTGKSEIIVLSTFLQDNKLKKYHPEPVSDLLFNENAIIPPRPAASLIQWVRGQTKYVSVQDLTSLITGPNRKPTNREESRLAHNISPEANPNQTYGYALGGTASTASSAVSGDRGYTAPVRGNTASNNYNFGTNGFMKTIQTGIESMEETFNGYASYANDAVAETVKDTKKSVYSAAFKDKLGF